MPHKGYKWTEEHRQNSIKNHRGSLGKHWSLTEEQRKHHSQKHPNSWNEGNIHKHNHWKGDNVGYRAVHKWMQKVLGKAKRCSVCGKKGAGREIHWANKYHKYTRNVKDYLELCAKCHYEYDKKHNLR